MNGRTVTRRGVLRVGSGGLAFGASCTVAPWSHAVTPLLALISETECAAIEASIGGRLGLSIVDIQSGASVQWRADERFALNSTFKTPLVGAILWRIDQGLEDPERALPITQDAIVPWSPVLKGRVGDMMTLSDLCEATLTTSDNAAANLLLKQLGGPKVLTEWMQARGAATARIDRYEPELNIVKDGDLRDTATPYDMRALLLDLLAGPVLNQDSQARLIGWMLANQTGSRRLRAGLPKQWRIADRTGTSRAGDVSNIALIWPAPKRAPISVAIYMRKVKVPVRTAEAQMAEIARLIALRTEL